MEVLNRFYSFKTSVHIIVRKIYTINLFKLTSNWTEAAKVSELRIFLIWGLEKVSFDFHNFRWELLHIRGTIFATFYLYSFAIQLNARLIHVYNEIWNVIWSIGVVRFSDFSFWNIIKETLWKYYAPNWILLFQVILLILKKIGDTKPIIQFFPLTHMGAHCVNSEVKFDVMLSFRQLALLYNLSHRSGKFDICI